MFNMTSTEYISHLENIISNIINGKEYDKMAVDLIMSKVEKVRKNLALQIDLMPVESSNLKSVGYNSDNQVLRVQFISGDTYQYDDVPPEIFNEMVNAKSVGSFYASKVRGKFETVKLGGNS